MLRRRHPRGDDTALTKGLLIAMQRLYRPALALSVIASQCHLSQGERHEGCSIESLRFSIAKDFSYVKPTQFFTADGRSVENSG